MVTVFYRVERHNPILSHILELLPSKSWIFVCNPMVVYNFCRVAIFKYHNFSLSTANHLNFGGKLFQLGTLLPQQIIKISHAHDKNALLKEFSINEGCSKKVQKQDRLRGDF